MGTNKKLSLKIKLALPVAVVALAVFTGMTMVIAKFTHDSTKRNAENFLFSAAESDARAIESKFEKAFAIAKTTKNTTMAKRKMGLVQRQVIVNELNENLVQNQMLLAHG